MANKDKWSNEPRRDDPELHKELYAQTPHERAMTELAEKNKDEKPLYYDIASKNARAMRVVYDHNNNAVAIVPGGTKRNVLLRPSTAERLAKGDLVLTHSDAAAAEPAA